MWVFLLSLTNEVNINSIFITRLSKLCKIATRSHKLTETKEATRGHILVMTDNVLKS